MYKINYYLILLFLLSIRVNGQILNGGFEQWSSGEPVYWQTNNVTDPAELAPITQTSFVHSGFSALKGEVLEIPMNGPTFTISPILVSGNLSNPYFSYNGRPDVIRGYYNFQSVGGDGFTANAFLLSGGNIVAVSGFTTSISTGSDYHELIMYFTYVDTISIPDAIQMLFQISPAPGGTFAHVGSVFYIDDFPKITLIKPPEMTEDNGGGQLVFISGEVDTIKWNCGGAQSVDIKYSTDNGANYQTVVNNYPGDSSRYFWHVPENLHTRKAKIKLLDHQPPNNEIESIEFTIKPWQLTRIDANNELELFEPAEDGWNFSNSPNLVWPQSWWQQFNYVNPNTGIDPYTNEEYPWWIPSFYRAKPSDFPDWSLFVNVFGIDACYTNSSNYNLIATSRWGSLIFGISDDWGGSCFGFAVSNLLGFYHHESLVPFIGNYTNLYSVPLDYNSQYVVNYYFQYQFSRENLQHQLIHYFDTPRELLVDLKEMFRKEDGDGRALSFFCPDSSGGHSVTPYKLERVGTSHSFNLRVSDSRAPGSSNQIILIDSMANQWTEYTGIGWGTGEHGCYLEPESGVFLSQPSLFRPGIELQSNEEFSRGNPYMTIYNTSNAEITISSTTGSQIGYQDSAVINTFTDAIPIIPKTGSFHPPIGYYLSEESYSLEINNFTDSLSYTFFFTDSTAYNYIRSDADNSQMDFVNFSEEGVGITNPDPVMKSAILETIISRDTISEKSFTIRNLQISSGDSIHFRERDRNELLLQNYGQGMNYDLQVRIVSVNSESNFFHMTIPMEQNSSHQIVPVWENLLNEPVKILIDLGNDGTIDDSLFIANQVTNVESQSYVGIPKEYHLLQNYPNPFNPSTTITFDLPVQSEVNLTVYNLLGQEVITLVNEVMQAGRHQIIFDDSKLSSGVYIYRIRARNFVDSKKMIFLK
jgi:Secretion system C-terminal sorting domain